MLCLVDVILLLSVDSTMPAARRPAAGLVLRSGSRTCLPRLHLQEYGLQPQQFVDVLALAGDASGAPGWRAGCAKTGSACAALSARRAPLQPFRHNQSAATT